MKRSNILTLVMMGLAFAAFPAFADKADLSKLPPAAKVSGVTYAKDIKPLFDASCIRCHGEQRPKAGLKLTTLEAVLKGSTDQKVIIPGKSEESPLVIAVARIDDETAMPPKRGGGGGGRRGPGGDNPPGGPDRKGPPPGEDKKSGGQPGQKGGPGSTPPKPLTVEQVAIVRAWVDQGAK